MENKIVCDRCGVELTEKKVLLRYLDFEFPADLPVCPQCGQVYISEDLVKGKVAQVEATLEDK